MPQYKAPLRDIKFVMEKLHKFQDHYPTLTECAEADPDLVDAILTEGAKFAEEVISPLNQPGDEEGCHWSEDGVTTPKGYKEAYQQYVEGGWPALAADAKHGGQGLPPSLGLVIQELMGSACWAWSMYPGLSHGSVALLERHGSPEQQERYLTKLISGEWTGTMCLTEAHAGSDVGLLRTKAVDNGDGTYSITGTKIFISSGDHDMADNICHLVLARLEGAPEGTKGISLFLVPKYVLNEDGTPGDRNSMNCGSIEHKMGINGSSTCVLNFDGATGTLVGKENAGLAAMFAMMNTARVGTAQQGLASGELSYQGAIAYARDRLQMRSLSGPKNASGPADPIIVHPNVRRMLLTQKALNEGNRAFIYWVMKLVDLAYDGPEEGREQADQLLGVLTPIAKAFITEVGNEITNLGMQVYGGHGYVKEWGMEQIVRDQRIATIYEGTTGIQALDLLGRKIMGSGGKLLGLITKEIHVFCKENDSEAMKPYVEPLAALNGEWGDITMKIGEKAMQNADEVGAASVDYLMFSGYMILGFMWAKMAAIALEEPEDEFMKAKIKTANFYFARLFGPRTAMHKAAMATGMDTLMEMEEAEFTL